MASENIPVQQEEPVVCLLGRLKCPIESDLACKRKVQTNHVRESREVKMPLLLNHRKFLSPLELIKNFLISPISASTTFSSKYFPFFLDDRQASSLHKTNNRNINNRNINNRNINNRNINNRNICRVTNNYTIIIAESLYS